MSDSDCVYLGKLLPDIKVRIEDVKPKSLTPSLESGEIYEKRHSKDDTNKMPSNEFIKKWMDTLDTPKIHSNKAGGFETGLNKSDYSPTTLNKKLDDRAQRFGLPKSERRQITQIDIDALYKSFGFDPEDLAASSKNLRLSALHMRGVDEMSTSEILKYFNDYGPSSIEWINDTSCNVCWLDDLSAARALLGMSKPFTRKTIHQDNIPETFDKTTEESTKQNLDVAEQELEAMEIDEAMEVVGSSKSSSSKSSSHSISLDLPIPIPPGTWRVGLPHPKAKALLLRFATKEDKKLPGAEKQSQYYQKHGNPNYGGIKGLISTSRKRKFQAQNNRKTIRNLSGGPSGSKDDRSFKEFPKRSKMPKMKMYADIEEEKKRKNLSGRLQKKGDIKKRLGVKFTQQDLSHLKEPFPSDDTEEEEFSVDCRIPARYNCWNEQARSMAAADPELRRIRKDYRLPFPTTGSKRKYDTASYNEDRNQCSTSKFVNQYDEEKDEEEELDDEELGSGRRNRYYAFRSERAEYEKKLQGTGDLRSKIVVKGRRKHRSILCTDSEDSN